MYGNIILKSKKDLYQYYNDKHIYDFYFSEYELDKKYVSPIRDEEDGSFMISYYDGSIVWRDFGQSFKPQDLLSLLSKINNIDFYTTLNKVYNDLKNNNIPYDKKIIQSIPNIDKLGIKCNFKFNQEELSYWLQGKITKKDLIKYRIYKGEIYKNRKLISSSKPNDPLFIYLFDKENKIWKSYRPYCDDTNYKFLSNNITSHIQGYNLLKYKSKTLIITKSYKDILVLNKLGYDAIAPHNEVIFIDPWDLDFLKTKYKYIYVFYDNDSTGIEYSNKYSELYNISNISIPLDYSFGNTHIKDSWDVVTHYNYKTLKHIIIKSMRNK